MPKVTVQYTIQETVEVELTDRQYAALKADVTGVKENKEYDQVVEWCLRKADEAERDREWITTEIYDGDEELYSI